MTIRHLSQIRSTKKDQSPAPFQGTPDFDRYSDAQLIAERDRRQQQLDQLACLSSGESDAYSLLASLDQEVGRITDELMRRARSRHPSSFRSA